MLNVTAATQAVWRAHEQVLGDECVLTETDMKALAAALRAAADQVVPKKPTLSYSEDYELGMWVASDDARVGLLAIAAELEAH